MSYLLVLHHAATVASTAGVIYAASIAVSVLVSLLAPSTRLRSDARETLKILLRRRR